ncbi:MAG: AbiV family abortive infection protein [Planctomycetes bacterium]|nr:AbiV family abortive infection protein [Planctomycetota bacterium]
MSSYDDRGPRPADQLMKNVFADRAPAEVCKVVADGIGGGWRNAERLLSDASLMVDAGRLSSARFLITTAREELAKSPLLLDACMVDFSKHRSVLQKICQAFYDHVAKHAYIELLEETLIDSMDRAGKFWTTAVRRWWPGDVEYGEPDMPHATHFDREFPLYLDFGDYEHRWLIPKDDAHRSHYEWSDRIAKVEKLIAPWRKADADGICTPEVLAIVNSVFKGTYVSVNTTTAALKRLYSVAEARLVAETGVSSEAFCASPLVRWPLYHFVAQGW